MQHIHLMRIHKINYVENLEAKENIKALEYYNNNVKTFVVPVWKKRRKNRNRVQLNSSIRINRITKWWVSSCTIHRWWTKSANSSIHTTNKDTFWIHFYQALVLLCALFILSANNFSTGNPDPIFEYRRILCERISDSTDSVIFGFSLSFPQWFRYDIQSRVIFSPLPVYYSIVLNRNQWV